jgi:hypothetical protein
MNYIFLIAIAVPVFSGIFYKLIDKQVDNIRNLNSVAVLCVVLLLSEIVSNNSILSISYNLRPYLHTDVQVDTLQFQTKYDSLDAIIELREIEIKALKYKLEQKQTEVNSLAAKIQRQTTRPANVVVTHQPHPTPRTLVRYPRIVRTCIERIDTTDIYRNIRPSVGQF